MLIGASRHATPASFVHPVAVENAHGGAALVLACEHASNYLPPEFERLGLGAADLERHIAWDLGALEVARQLSRRLDAPLVYATHSRLLYDVNRAEEAHDAIVAVSEGTPIPGNQALDAAARRARYEGLYQPFHAALERAIGERVRAGRPPAVVTIHSFTPTWHGKSRPWHVGVISHRDRRLADALLAMLSAVPDLVVGDNKPYKPDDGVYHTLGRHAEARKLPCVMLELRQDLIADADGQERWADRLLVGLEHALASVGTKV
jgi:predicted N-formylglutamate amidohydrolase